VWCRDTLSCLPDCGLALRECARVLRPGGGMVLYAVFAGERLEAGDQALLVQGRAGQALTGSLGSGHWLYQCRLGGLSSLNACSGGGA
jgi:hypothetical protein